MNMHGHFSPSAGRHCPCAGHRQGGTGAWHHHQKHGHLPALSRVSCPCGLALPVEALPVEARADQLRLTTTSSPNPAASSRASTRWPSPATTRRLRRPRSRQPPRASTSVRARSSAPRVHPLPWPIVSHGRFCKPARKSPAAVLRRRGGRGGAHPGGRAGGADRLWTRHLAGSESEAWLWLCHLCGWRARAAMPAVSAAADGSRPARPALAIFASPSIPA